MFQSLLNRSIWDKNTMSSAWDVTDDVACKSEDPPEGRFTNTIIVSVSTIQIIRNAHCLCISDNMHPEYNI